MKSIIDFKKYPAPRIRHHVASNLYHPQRSLKNLTGCYPPVPGVIDWKLAFKNGRQPDVIDLGSGFGKFLFEYSLKNPDSNILGLEVRKPAAEWVEYVIQSEGIKNAACLWYNAANRFPFLQANSIRKIFYLFPDPWIKKKHNKRRIVSPDMAEEIYRVLKPGGEVFIKTDVEELYDHHKNVFEADGRFIVKTLNSDAETGIVTSREEFCINNRISFSRMLCTKI